MPLKNFKNRPQLIVILLTIIIFIVNAGSWVLIFWKIPYTDHTILLHYNVFFGIDLTGTWRELFWVPGTGLVVAIFNIIILYATKIRRYLYKMLFLFTTLLLELLLLLATVLLILLNS